MMRKKQRAQKLHHHLPVMTAAPTKQPKEGIKKDT
jgi:hypothetical protein